MITLDPTTQLTTPFADRDGPDDRQDGRERLRFIAGDVAVPPFPAWAQSDDALASVSALIRRLHDASRGLDLSDCTWSDEMADPEGGPVLCHNDVCLENVVFRDGAAVGLLDFDFVAPGRAVWDLARFATVCVPLATSCSQSLIAWWREAGSGS
jgi:thiamine kinase-like enzyme